MDKYNADIEYRFDCRVEDAVIEDIVFWRETGWKEEEEAVDARD